MAQQFRIELVVEVNNPIDVDNLVDQVVDVLHDREETDGFVLLDSYYDRA